MSGWRLSSALAILLVCVGVGAVVSAAGAVRAGILSAAFPTVSCDSIPGGVVDNGHDPGYRRILGGAVSVPPRYLANVGDDPAAAPFRKWTKAGLMVRSGTALTVQVPPRFRDRVRITWGGQEGVALRFAACSIGTAYNAYAGGFLARSRAICVPLLFTVRRHSATLVFGIGRRC